MALGAKRWLCRSGWSCSALHPAGRNGPLHTAGCVHDCATWPNRSYAAIELRANVCISEQSIALFAKLRRPLAGYPIP